MKKILIFIFLSIATVFTGCVVDAPKPDGGSLTVTLDVDDIVIGSPSPTRGSISAQEGETTVNNLRLLFFEHKPDGSGRFVKSVIATNPAMNGQYNIPFDADIIETQSYTILAIANVADTPDINCEGLSEREAIDKVTVRQSNGGTDQNNNSLAIDPANLIMTTRVVRSASQNTIAINLTRAMVRFDVQNAVRTDYDLVSASIWGAVMELPLWHDRVIPTATRTERFYGIARTSDFGDIERGLYAFGNYVAKPELTDKVTTCLIIGLKPAGNDLAQTTYYRVNVNIPGSAQNLVRNHVYRIRIDEVTGTGADTEYEAWTKSSTLLRVSINGWNSDDGGMIKTDGKNILILPVKLVNLDPAGDKREYSIFTKGTGTLTISKHQLPAGIKAELINGRLIVTADPFPAELVERRGSIELSYAGLSGDITFVQSPLTSRFLTLNRYELPEFAPDGRTHIKDNVPFKISASGAWTATIYNMSDNAENPGFSFESTGTPVTVLRSFENPFVEMFQVFTTGSNPDFFNKRHSFMVVSLNEDQINFSRVVVLTQTATGL